LNRNMRRSISLSSATLGCLLILLVDSQGQAQNSGAANPSTVRSVAVTVDDLPGAAPGTDHDIGNLRDLERVNRAIPGILHAHAVPAIGFVNEWKLQISGERDARAALLQMWIDAAMDLGNHTYTHPDFDKVTLAQYEDETIRGEVVTRALLAAAGRQERYFRHPFLNTGPTLELKVAFESFLSERGYRIAPVTVAVDDYEFNDILGEALDKKDKKLAEKTKAAYLDYVDIVFDFFEDASRKLFGREIPQVLLIHDNEINTQCLDALLKKLERRGYHFVSLDQAMTDPAYLTPDQFVGLTGISWIDRWKVALGQKPDYENNPEPPAWVGRKFEEIRRAHAQ
jgi:peptidoglycan/xylan/chitin deacetylase (PgdA/CDA1 family)